MQVLKIPKQALKTAMKYYVLCELINLNNRIWPLTSSFQISTYRETLWARYILWSCVRRLSVTRRYCRPTKTAKRRIMQTTLYHSTETHVFWWQRSRRNSNGVTSNGNTKRPNRGGGGTESAIFNQYLAISQKRCKTGTQLPWNAIDLKGPPTAPNHSIFDFCIAFLIFLMVGR